RVHGDGAQIQRFSNGDLESVGGRARGTNASRSAAPARRPLRRGGEARTWRKLSVPARLGRWIYSPGIPGRGSSLLPTDGSRIRGGLAGAPGAVPQPKGPSQAPSPRPSPAGRGSRRAPPTRLSPSRRERQRMSSSIDERKGELRSLMRQRLAALSAKERH